MKTKDTGQLRVTISKGGASWKRFKIKRPGLKNLDSANAAAAKLGEILMTAPPKGIAKYIAPRTARPPTIAPTQTPGPPVQSFSSPPPPPSPATSLALLASVSAMATASDDVESVRRSQRTTKAAAVYNASPEENKMIFFVTVTKTACTRSRPFCTPDLSSGQNTFHANHLRTLEYGIFPTSRPSVHRRVSRYPDCYPLFYNI